MNILCMDAQKADVCVTFQAWIFWSTLHPWIIPKNINMEHEKLMNCIHRNLSAKGRRKTKTQKIHLKLGWKISFLFAGISIKESFKKYNGWEREHPMFMTRWVIFIMREAKVKYHHVPTFSMKVLCCLFKFVFMRMGDRWENR